MVATHELASARVTTESDNIELFDLADAPQTALVVVAHPDDIDFGIAGTVAALSGAGTTVTYALCTSGEAGIPEEMDRSKLAALRQAEQRTAAAAVGVTDVRFLDMPDGHLEANLELRAAISRVIRQTKPQVVISQSPERRYDSIYASHPDHLASGEATIAAVYPDARNPHAHTHLLAEGHKPHAVSHIWIAGGPNPNLAVDITTHIDAKAAALSSHSSQISSIDDVQAMLHGWATETATRHNLSERAPLVEVFTKVNT